MSQSTLIIIITSTCEYAARYRSIIGSIRDTSRENSEIQGLKLKMNELFHENKEIRQYFHSLYWWILTTLQAFRFGETELFTMNTDIFDKRTNVKLKKLAAFTLEMTQIVSLV